MRRGIWLQSLTTRLPTDLARDDRGFVFIYFTMLAAALVGFVGLSVDLGRFATTNTQAKSAADASALAAATAMANAVRAAGADPSNPQPVIDAIRAAAQSTVQNRQSFATVSSGGSSTTGGTVRITDVRLLTSLPELNGGSAATPTDAYVTGDPWRAKFVEVTTESLNQTNLFVTAVGSERVSSTRARAVAGFTQVMCNVPPLWICNPAEQNGIGEIFNPSAWRGHEALLKASGSGSQWAPGNFGLLDSPAGNGASAVAQMLASATPNACFKQDGANLRPGQASSIRTALNTRFDMYENPYFGGNADRRNPLYRPAKNVIKGIKWTSPGNCTGPVAAGMALPDDSNLSATSRFGNGQWNCAAYWAANHSGSAPSGCTNPSQMSRYDIYRYEIDHNLIPTGTPVHGEPQCYKGAASDITDDPDRRVLYFAMINCLQMSQNGNPLNGNRDNVPVAAFGKAFLPRPVADTPGDEIVIEFIDVVRPSADDGVLHEIVQLYR